MKESFVFYKSYKDAIENIDDKEIRLKFYECIIDYVFNGRIPDKDDTIVYSLFAVIKDTLDKENKSYLNYKERVSSDYKKWKKSVLKRDNYKCTKCGSKESLNVHHIKSFSENKDLRFDINNGITLCNNCHIEVHKNEK